ncbi:MAG: MlaD family protein [Kiritimatiellia bacterium]
MKQNKKYFAIGIFVLAGFVLLAIGCILFGGGQMFPQKLYFETYFASSVQGLDVGGPVKFRGVKVGTIESIGFSGSTYGTSIDSGNASAKLHRAFSYIRVVCSFDLKRYPDFETERVSAMVVRGLRAKLDLQGITGVVFVNLDFLRPADLPNDEPLVVPWMPEHIYIPSIPNSIQTLMNVIESIARRLDSIDFPKTMDAITSLAQNVDRAVTESKVPELSASVKELVHSLNVQTNKIAETLDKVDMNRLSADLQTLVRNLAETSDAVRAAVPRLTNSTDSTLTQVQTTLTSMDQVLENLNAIISKTRRDVEVNDIGATLESLNRTSAQLEALSQSLRDRPSRLFFDDDE